MIIAVDAQETEAQNNIDLRADRSSTGLVSDGQGGTIAVDRMRQTVGKVYRRRRIRRNLTLRATNDGRSR